ncbi:hypothetical protein [Sphingobacterium bovisgrunnientis]|uniref:hypothetical protein n=1 Tax=Sphingobacterium bovisgrunnientis TaxID=1874697 RepID=UPI00135C9AB7|nr:hypothetical protein [Sphingobacterium bovisgrunnientis]
MSGNIISCPRCRTKNDLSGEFQFDNKGNATLINGLKSLSKEQLLSLLNIASITKDHDHSKKEFIENLSALGAPVINVITEELEKNNNFKLFILALIFYISIALNFKNNIAQTLTLNTKPKIENPIKKSLDKKSSKNYSEADSAMNKARRALRNHQRSNKSLD